LTEAAARGVSVTGNRMSKRVTRLCFAAAAAAVLGFAALNVLAYNHARAMMRFTRAGSRTVKPEALSTAQKIKVLLLGVNVPRPAGGRTPADEGLAFEPVTVPGPDGIRLGCWHCPNVDGSALAILFHGYGADKSSLLAEAAAFHRLGLSALLADSRGSGESSESYTTVGFREAEDVAAVMSYAEDRLPHAKLVLFGQSMGAAAVLRAIHSHGVKPDAVIVEAVFDRMLNTVRNRFDAMGVPSFPSAELLVFWGGRRAGFDGFRHNPVEYARSVVCPILFLHGSDDPRARVEEGRRVFDAVSAPKSLKEFPRTGHEAYVTRFSQEWREAVGKFLGGI